MSKMNMVQALNSAFMQEMEKDSSILILGEDVGVDGGVFRVTDGLVTKFGHDRVFDTPLAEAGIIGVSTGLAINGFKPVCEIQFADFCYQGFHHLEQHLARFRQRTSGTFHLPMVVRTPSGGGIRALEHHSESPEAFFTHMMGVKIVMPSGPYDAKGLMISAIRDPDPVIFLEPKKIYRSFKEEVPDSIYTIPLGESNIVREGKDLTLVSWGAMVRLGLEAAEAMAKEGISVEVIDLRTIWPLDMDKIIPSVKKTGRAVILHEAPRTAGMGAELAARIQEQCLLHLEAPIVRVTGLDIPFPQFALENYHMPDLTRVMRGIKKAIHF